MSCFFRNLGPIYIEQIKRIIDCRTINLDDDSSFNNLVGINFLNSQSLSFLYDDQKIAKNYFPNSTIICTEKKIDELSNKQMLIIVKDVQNTLAVLSKIFYRSLSKSEISKLNRPVIGENSNISKKSSIENGAILGKNVFINDGVKIGYNCIIGDNSNIDTNTVITNTILGDNVNIGRNSSIGQKGFGFAIKKDANIDIFHIGRVILKSGVSIGSNCSIDRGSFSDTIIGENTYFDNLCHVAHNVIVGNNSVFAAMTGIAGSAKIGNHVMAGGQSGISGHINIGNNVRIAAKSGVFNDVKDGTSVMGNPAINMFSYLKKYKKYYGSK